MRLNARVLLLTCCCALCGGVTSCAAPHATTSTQTPADFAISVTVFATKTSDTGPRGPEWLLLGSDNALRLQSTARTPDSPPPPVVRVLSNDDVSRVYSLASNAGLMDARTGLWRIGEEREALPTGIAEHGQGIVVETVAHGRRRTVLALPGSADNAGSAVFEAVERLALALESLARPAAAAER